MQLKNLHQCIVYIMIILDKKNLCVNLSIKAEEKGRSGQSSERVSEVQSYSLLFIENLKLEIFS